LSVKWRNCQEKYTKKKGGKRFIKIWASELIEKRWKEIWSVTNTRNDAKPRKDNSISVIESEMLNGG